jgi:hypothetical protein
LIDDEFILTIARDLDRRSLIAFRATCKRFHETGNICLYSKVAIRFSQSGFQNLEAIAGKEKFAKHVREFSYIVPCFLVEGPLALYSYLFIRS